MKKLLVSMFIAAIGISVSAANCKWDAGCFGATGIADSQDFDFAYAVINLGTTSVSADSIIYDGTTIKVGGTTITGNDILASGTECGWGKSGNIGDQVIAGNYYTAVIWSGDKELYGVGEIVQASKSAMDPTGNTYDDMNFYNAQVAIDGGLEVGIVATQVAPEPTSGLLMLLGIAGLALKRKHA